MNFLHNDLGHLNGGEVVEVSLKVPQSGHWHVAIDLGGRSGTIRAGGATIDERARSIRLSDSRRVQRFLDSPSGP
jgi:hypothetical protein